MLCPNCGVYVGDKVALCPVCAEARKSALAEATRAPGEPQTAPSSAATSNSTTEPSKPTIDANQEGESTEAPTLGLPRWFIPFLIFDVLVLIAALVALYVTKYQKPKVTIRPYSATSTPIVAPLASSAAVSSSSGLVSSSSGAAEATSPAEISIPAVPGGSVGIISVNGTQYTFASAAFLYFKHYKRLEVGFYREPIAPLEEQQLRSKGAISVLNGKMPMLVANLVFDGDPRSADKSFLKTLNISFRNYALNSLNTTNGQNYFEFDRTGHINDAGEIVALSGILQEGKPMSLGIKGTAVDEKKNSFAWNVRFDLYGSLLVVEGG